MADANRVELGAPGGLTSRNMSEGADAGDPHNPRPEPLTQEQAEAIISKMSPEQVEALARLLPPDAMLDALRNHTPHLAGYQHDPEVKRVHRFIGAFITTFAELVTTMRNHTREMLVPSAPTGEFLLEALFETLTAEPIQRAFFAVSSSLVEHDRHEAAIRSVLRRRVREEIEFRNDVVHADWSLGWRDADTDEPVPPAVQKIKPAGGVVALRALDIDVETLLAHINRVQDLRWDLDAYAMGCLGTARGADVRILDFLALVPGKRGAQNEVRRVDRDPEKVRLVAEARVGAGGRRYTARDTHAIDN